MARKRFDNLKTVPVCITATQKNQLEQVAQAEGTSLSHVVRRIIDERFYLSSNITDSDKDVHVA
jgi:hypothetical protein